MALIGTIRKNSWVLFVSIGVALAAFLIMDMVGQSSQYSMGNMSLGKVDGKDIDYREFMAHEEAVYAGGGSDMYTRRNFLWNYYLNKILFDKEAEANGLKVGREELLNLEFGNQLSPVISQRFMNPQTGGIDYQQLNSLRQQIESGTMPEETKRFWAWQEKEIITDRMEAKVYNLVSKAFYSPSWMVDRLMEDQSDTKNIAYVKIPFNKSTGFSEVTDAQITDYMKSRKNEFYHDHEERVLEYMTIEVLPTAKDSAEVRNRILELKKEFETTENDTNFIQSYEGEFRSAYQYREGLSPLVADSAYSLDIGSVFGPYTDGDALRISKIINRKVVPDSVRSRHILLMGQTQPQLMEAYQKADSLKQVIEAGTETFDSIARQYGEDASAPQGGELGYAAQGQMVGPFNDLIFYEAEEGKIYTVVTQFGVHLVEVLGKKFINNREGVQLASVSEDYLPSQETQDSLYSITQEFLSDARTLSDLKKLIADRPEHRLLKADPVESNGFLFADFGQGQVSRDIIRWAFDNKTQVGQLSSVAYIYQDPELFYNNRYVIVGLDEIRPAGYPDPESVRLNVEQLVLDQMRGKEIAEKIGQTSSLDIVAHDFDVEVDTAYNVSFFSDVVEGIGEEPKLVAAVKNTNVDQITPPIVGNTGVFVAQPFSRQSSGAGSYSVVRDNSVSQMVEQTPSALLESLKKDVKIKDNRSEFY